MRTFRSIFGLVCLVFAAGAVWVVVASDAESGEHRPRLHLVADDGQRPGEGNGIGGTGLQPGEGNGIGGTGQVVDGSDRTGVVGAITGFGSIYVNGLHIRIDDDMPVEFKDRVVPAGELGLGHVVAVEADGKGDDLRALSASVQHEVGGPVERIDRAAGTFTVLGQTVKAPAGEGDRGVAFDILSVGSRVDVSGFRTANGTIEATRLDRIARADPDYVSGPVDQVDAAGFVVGGLRIPAAPETREQSVAVGSVLAVTGTALRGGFRPQRVRVLPALPFTRRVGRLSIEGFVVRRNTGALRIGRWRVAAPAGALSTAARNRVVITGGLGRDAHLLRPAFRPARAIKRRGRRLRQGRRLRRGPAARQHVKPWRKKHLNQRPRPRRKFNGGQKRRRGR